MKIGLKHLLLTTALFGVLAPVAAAQDNPFLRGRYQKVDERQQPEYDPAPMHAGAFDINASLDVLAEYNDNVFAQPSNGDDDTIIRLRPRVDAVSTWSSNQLAAGIALDHREYLSDDSETSTDYNAYVGGRLDATRTFQLTGRVEASQATEERYEPASNNSPEPAQDQATGATVGAIFRSDRIQLEGNVGTRDDNYQSFFNYRDVTSTFFGGRASYAVSPDVALFVQARQTDENYDLTGSNRDGKQTSVQVGTSFELAAPFRGEISVGQVKDNRDDPTQPDTDSFSLDAAVYWFPTELTTVTFRGNTGVSDPGIAQAISADYQRYSVRVDHELLRNVLLFGQFGFGSYDFNAAAGSGFARKDDSTDVSIGAAYKLNRNAHLEVGYRFHNQDSKGQLDLNPLNRFDTSTDQNVLSVGIKLYP